MDLDRICEVGSRADEGQVARVFGTGFVAGSLAGIGASCNSKIKDDFDMELTEVSKVL